jgi:hypothetical protein
VTRIAVDIRSSFFVTVQATFHIVSVDHSDRSFFQTRKSVADGAIHPAPDMNPVRKDDMAWKFVHPLPRNVSVLFDILEEL